MEVGGCGLSAQIAGEIGNVQLDYDGTPMVTDMMTEREVRTFSRALGSLGRGVAQMTGPLETAAVFAVMPHRAQVLAEALGASPLPPAEATAAASTAVA